MIKLRWYSVHRTNVHITFKESVKQFFTWTLKGLKSSKTNFSPQIGRFEFYKKIKHEAFWRSERAEF